MPNRPTVFLDFDDTLSDPVPFFSQFAREVGAILSAKFGGEQHVWERAAADMLVTVQDEYLERFVGRPTNGYSEWLSALRRRSIELICASAGRSLPANYDGLSLAVQFEAMTRCNAAFPGADQALAALREAGCVLHMASGQESEYLRGGLTGMGLRGHLDRLFGPDLVDCAKEGPEYYARVFAAVEVRGAEVIVVDDFPPAIGWALAEGANVIQAKLTPIRHEETIPGVAAVLTDLHDLPRLVAEVAATLR